MNSLKQIRYTLLLFFSIIFLSAHPCMATYEIGMGKAKMDMFFKGSGMNGYGEHCNRVVDEKSSLYARSLLIKDVESDSLILFINCEIGSISHSIKTTLLDTLLQLGYQQLSERNVMITATHTHSAPGGYQHYAFYNFSYLGYHEFILKGIVKGIVQSVQAAFSNLQPATIHYNEGKFTSQDQVAYNRSLKAYNRNFPKSEWPKHTNANAMDSTMIQLRFEDAKGKNLGILNWFGVHATSIGNVNQSISSDNKGYASTFFEEHMDNESVAIFAQPASGDISPLYHGQGQWKKSKDRRKKLKDNKKSKEKIREIINKQYEEAENNGRKQYQKAIEIHSNRATEQPVSGSIDYDLFYVNMSGIQVAPEFVNGDENALTCAAVYGIAFSKGTPVDGIGTRGFERFIAGLLSGINKSGKPFIFLRGREKRQILRAYFNSQGKKKGFVDASNNTIMITNDLRKLPALDPMSSCVRQHARNGAFQEFPLVQHILPVQLFIVGNLAIVGQPSEMTTVAALELKNQLMPILAKRGVEKIIISTFSNAYAGYVTTQAEYQVQAYEGGHTLFGQWELGAFKMKFSELASEMLKSPSNRNLDRITRPPVIPERVLRLREFDDSQTFFEK